MELLAGQGLHLRQPFVAVLKRDDREAREEACNTEADKAAHRTGRGPSFLDAASKGFYGPGSDSGASLGEALNRRAFYSERPGAD